MALRRNKTISFLVSIAFLLSIFVFPESCSTVARGSVEEYTARETPDSADLAILDTLVTRTPSEIDNSKLPVTPTEKLHTTGSPQKVDIEQYRLTVVGLVENEQSINYSELLSLPSVTKIVLLICYGTFADNAEWTGMPVSEILAKADVKDGATAATFTALDGYEETIPLDILEKEGAFLAYKVNGEILLPEHGYPVRLVVEGEYGKIWVKWIKNIEIT
jgi:DMSO/TMAO reductase YedYZ molybdopterin-dependent catalytic subunit